MDDVLTLISQQYAIDDFGVQQIVGEESHEIFCNVINLKQPLNGRQNVWKYQKGEGKSDSDGREKDVG